MKRLTINLAVIQIAIFSTIANAEEIQPSQCQNIQTSNDVLNCVKENHVEIRLGNAILKESALGIDIAKQRPNPEFGVEGFDNKAGGFTTELSLLHTFELGGKRRARKYLALAKQKSSGTNLLKAQENAIIQTVLNLYRLKQIKHDIKLLKENLSIFRQVRKQYDRVGKLNPEQVFSDSIFKIAEDGNLLEITQLEDEKNQVTSSLHLAAGKEFKISQKIFPKDYSKWPSIGPSRLNGSDIQKLDNDIEISKGKYGIQKSQSWPNLSVGPKVELNNGNNDQTKFGFSLRVPLPMYQVNRAGRSKARLEIKRNELRSQLMRKQLKVYRANLVKAYNNITRMLKRSQKESEIKKRHSRLHSLLDRGVVSAPIIIELHREIQEFHDRLHEQELRAVEILWKIYALDGHILEEKLP